MPAGRRPAVSPARSAGVVALVALALGASACTNRDSAVQKHPHTGSGSASSVPGGEEVTVRAGSDLRFHPSRLTVGPGRLRVVLDNTEKPGQGAPHNLQVGGVPSAVVPLTTAGQQSSITFTAPAPGTYRFVCTIHEAQGQTGTLVVTK